MISHRPSSQLQPTYPQEAAKDTPPAPCGCTKTPKGPMRRFCEGLLPRPRGIQSNPEQPEPPMNAAALQRLWSAGGSGGRHSLAFPPAALRFPACVSLRLPQASLRDCKQSLSLVTFRATFVFGLCKPSASPGFAPRLHAIAVARRAQRDLHFDARKRPCASIPAVLKRPYHQSNPTTKRPSPCRDGLSSILITSAAPRKPRAGQR